MLVSTSYSPAPLPFPVTHSLALSHRFLFQPKALSGTRKGHSPPLGLVLISNWPMTSHLEALAFSDLRMCSGTLHLNISLWPQPCSTSSLWLSAHLQAPNLCHPNHWSPNIFILPSQWCAGKGLMTYSIEPGMPTSVCLLSCQHKRHEITCK